MKKIIFSSLLFCSFFAKAQFTQGDKYIGGNVELEFSTSSFNQNSSISTSSGKNFGIDINPQFLKAANANTLRGFTVGLNFAHSTTNQNQNATYYKGVNNNTGVSIGYAIRKYKPITEKIFWYMEYNGNIGYNYSWQNSTNTNIVNNSKIDEMGYNVNISALPALAVKASAGLLVDVNFGGLSTGYNYSSSEGNHNHNYFLNFNLTSRFSLGLLWKLKKSGRS